MCREERSRNVERERRREREKVSERERKREKERKKEREKERQRERESLYKLNYQEFCKLEKKLFLLCDVFGNRQILQKYEKINFYALQIHKFCFIYIIIIHIRR